MQHSIEHARVAQPLRLGAADWDPIWDSAAVLPARAAVYTAAKCADKHPAPPFIYTPSDIRVQNAIFGTFLSFLPITGRQKYLHNRTNCMKLWLSFTVAA